MKNTNTNTLTEAMKSLIKETINNSDNYLTYGKKANCFYGEIYADYRDEFSDEDMSKILNSDFPQERFNETLYEMYFDYEWELKVDVIQFVINELEDNEEIGYVNFKDYCNENSLNDDSIKALSEWQSYNNTITELIQAYCEEHIYFELPYEHYLKQEVCIDILVDTGDLNYDYTLNSMYPHYNSSSEDEIDGQASLAWLSSQQGYNKEHLEKALKEEMYNGSKFLKSVREEVLNASTSMNCLTFLVGMTLEDAIKLQERIKEDKKIKSDGSWYDPKNRLGTDFITIDKRVECGLFDTWNGGGGCLEIELEKDIKLPLKYIDSIEVDKSNTRGYGVADVYGLDSSPWRDVVKL